MKKTLYISIFALCIFLIANIYVKLSLSKSAKGKIESYSTEKQISIIKFSSKEIDFGVLPIDTLVYAEFFIYNKGVNLLIIEEVNPECSCTGYQINKDSIPPNDSTKLIIGLSTKGKDYGIHRKAITIKSNTEKKYNTLFIKCQIGKRINVD